MGSSELVMSETRSEFPNLMQRLRHGSDGAVRELVDRYGPLLKQIIRQRLHRKLRPKFDSIDFTQAVWASFFADPDRIPTFDNAESLAAYLGGMARNKVVEAFRQRVQTQKYDVDKEQSLEGSTGGRATQLPAVQPTPSQFVMAEEEWSRMLEGQPAHKRQVLALLRQGFTHQEIAARVGINEKTIRRLIRQIHPGLVP